VKGERQSRFSKAVRLTKRVENRRFYSLLAIVASFGLLLAVSRVVLDNDWRDSLLYSWIIAACGVSGIAGLLRHRRR
jgi:ATP/ADP translocase